MTATDHPAVDIIPLRWRMLLSVWAAIGILVNAFLVDIVVQELGRARSAAAELLHDHRAFGHVVPPATVMRLQEPFLLWFAGGALSVAAIFGIYFAVELLISMLMYSSRSQRCSHKLDRYSRFKPWGAVATGVTFFLFFGLYWKFWVDATQHVPVGSGPPWIEAITIIGLAQVPCWLLWRTRSTGFRTFTEPKASNRRESRVES
jgi:hypothetical protein